MDEEVAGNGHFKKRTSIYPKQYYFHPSKNHQLDVDGTTIRVHTFGDEIITIIFVHSGEKLSSHCGHNSIGFLTCSGISNETSHWLQAIDAHNSFLDLVCLVL